jgi:hypothetical protein
VVEATALRTTLLAAGGDEAKIAHAVTTSDADTHVLALDDTQDGATARCRAAPQGTVIDG